MFGYVHPLGIISVLHCISGINQCEIMPDLCENGDCINLQKGYRCSCYDGYRTDSSERACISKFHNFAEWIKLTDFICC